MSSLKGDLQALGAERDEIANIEVPGIPRAGDQSAIAASHQNELRPQLDADLREPGAEPIVQPLGRGVNHRPRGLGVSPGLLGRDSHHALGSRRFLRDGCALRLVNAPLKCRSGRSRRGDRLHLGLILCAEGLGGQGFHILNGERLCHVSKDAQPTRLLLNLG